MWLPWSPSNAHSKPSAENQIKRPSPEELKLDQAEEDVRRLNRAWEELCQLSFGTYSLLGLSAFVIFSAGWATHRKWDSIHSRYFKRIRRHYDVPDSYIREKRYLKGIVTEVPDGDGFSFFHTPGPGWRWPLKFRRLPESKRAGGSQVIRMRMAAIDAPEVSRGAAEGQLFSIESRDWLRNQILGKTIYCQLLKRETMYGRMIVLPFLPRKFLPWWLTGNYGTNLSEEIVRQGWAFVYESPDGVFPHPEKRVGYVKLMSQAQEVKAGMWKRGTSLETPAHYKKRAKQGFAPENTDTALEESEGLSEDESWFLQRLKSFFRRH